MKITQVNIKKIESAGKLKAFVNITIDGIFMIHDIKIFEGKNGYNLVMPSRERIKGENNKNLDVVHPVNKETRELFEKVIIGKYKEIYE